jgi:hypothetical protein
MLYPFPPACGSSSPWGPIQTVTPLGPDAVVVTTAYLVLGLDTFERDAARGAECWAAARTTLSRYHPAHAPLVAALLSGDGGHD